MQVPVSGRIRGPLVRREGRKRARLIEGVGVLLDLVPQMSRTLVTFVLWTGAVPPANLRRPLSPSTVAGVKLRETLVFAGPRQIAGLSPNLATRRCLVSRI